MELENSITEEFDLRNERHMRLVAGWYHAWFRVDEAVRLIKQYNIIAKTGDMTRAFWRLKLRGFPRYNRLILVERAQEEIKGFSFFEVTAIGKY